MNDIHLFDVTNEVYKYAECPHCSKQHRVLYGTKILKDGTKGRVAFIECGRLFRVELFSTD